MKQPTLDANRLCQDASLRPRLQATRATLRLAIRLQLVAFAPQPLHLRLQFRNPPQQRGHLFLQSSYDIFHDAHNFTNFRPQAKTNSA
jgi:hypothetical protein